MRALALVLGLVAITLAVPPQALNTREILPIVQHSQAEFVEVPRLSSDRLNKRHEHHEVVKSKHTEAHAMETITGEEMKEVSLEESSGIESSPNPTSVSATPASHVHTHHSHGGGGGDGHDHHHSREPPKLELNETEILLTHAPDPPSYLDLDYTEDGMAGTMIAHVILMSVAFFGSLPLGELGILSFSSFLQISNKDAHEIWVNFPSDYSRRQIAIFLKAGRSRLSILPQIGFLVFSIFGSFLGRIYAWSTPEMYEGSSHNSWGWSTVVIAIALNLVDVARFLLSFTRFHEKFESIVSSLKSKAGLSNDNEKVSKLNLGSEERVALVESPAEEYSPSRWSTDQAQSSPSSSRGNSSTFSDADTIYDSAGPEALQSALATEKNSTRSRLQTFVSKSLDLAMRLLVILAYINVCSGIVVYTGLCRENYLNGCLAHGIKGSIFLWYGLLTFARYCGGMSALGWAWNRRPSGSGFTAEFVESFVIFLYGSTNTWMERMGKTGAYSVKDVQHISIAVMFWAAGSLGMLLESRTVRSWLATPATQASSQDHSRIARPASSSFSFNPFPALVIGVTGIAMSAHHQTYQFQVEIHAMWGVLLAAFSLFRFLTYFFLYLRPPASILPSRPPTEALASLFLSCGGVVFVLSTEQITFAAMRHQADDMMAFLNVTFAFVCICFLWIAVLFGIKGWALKRNEARSVLQNPSVKSA
ncbi:hypothetical protein JCM5350_007864 [Sporobolomyces pararoseus]